MKIDIGHELPLPKCVYGYLKRLEEDGQNYTLTYIPEKAKFNGEEILLDSLEAFGKLISLNLNDKNGSFPKNYEFSKEIIKEKQSPKRRWVLLTNGRGGTYPIFPGSSQRMYALGDYKENQDLIETINRDNKGAHISEIIDTFIHLYVEGIKQNAFQEKDLRASLNMVQVLRVLDKKNGLESNLC